ncbi:hypothetical protein GW17_00006439 [Ensete ventricosum]|nr:hypothetical protein GW17_00006439 [Ensete ventricosum]
MVGRWAHNLSRSPNRCLNCPLATSKLDVLFFPSLFALLLSSSPVIVCTTLLLGILLSYSEPNLPGNKADDDDTAEASSSLKTESVANEKGFRAKSRVGNRRATKRLTVRTTVLGDRRLNAAEAARVASNSSIEEDKGSDSESGGAQDSDSSKSNTAPVLDELDPFVSEDDSGDDSAASSQNHASDDGSTEAEEADNQDEEEAEKEKDEGGGKAAVRWTADDERNLVNLGNSELERNRRLETLLAKREARKVLQRNLIDLDGNMEKGSQSQGHLPWVNAPRRNPLDLSGSSDDSFPGSAPCVLLPRLSPFDLADDDPVEEEKNSRQQDLVAAPQRDIFFTRHESFSVGSFFGEFKQEKRVSRLNPCVGAQKNEPEAIACADSKMNSPSESDEHNAKPSSDNSMITEQAHQATASEDSVGNSPTSYGERVEVIDEEYKSSSSTASSEEEKRRPTPETTAQGSISDAVEVEVDDSHVVEPVYGSSPTASNSALH